MCKQQEWSHHPLAQAILTNRLTFSFMLHEPTGGSWSRRSCPRASVSCFALTLLRMNCGLAYTHDVNSHQNPLYYTLFSNSPEARNNAEPKHINHADIYLRKHTTHVYTSPSKRKGNCCSVNTPPDWPQLRNNRNILYTRLCACVSELRAK